MKKEVFRAIALLAGLAAACTCLAQEPVHKKDEPQTTKSFLIWLARVAGLSATPSGLRDIEVGHQGDVWSEPVGGGTTQRLTADGGYSWPIFSSEDRSVIALRGGELWSLPLNGDVPLKLAHSPAGVTGLVGSGSDGIVVFSGKQIGTFQPDSRMFTPFVPVSREDNNEINRLMGPIRAYNGGLLTVSERSNSILVADHGKEREIAPEKAAVWQPSVSHDRRSLVYIRSTDSSSNR